MPSQWISLMRIAAVGRIQIFKILNSSGRASRQAEMRADGLLIATDNADVDAGMEALSQRIDGEHRLPG